MLLRVMGSFHGLGIGIVIAFFHSVGKYPRRMQLLNKLVIGLSCMVGLLYGGYLYFVWSWSFVVVSRTYGFK